MIETFQKYGGSGLILIWFLVAWVYLLLKEEKKQNRVMFVYFPAGILLLFFNPLFFKVFGDITEEAIYFRFIWLLPITIVIAYTIVKIRRGLQGTKKTVFSLIAVLLIMISGKPVYSNPLFERAENQYHVPAEVVEICDSIRVEGREVMAAFPREFLLYVRQYSPYVCMPYGRDSLGLYNELLDVLEQDVVDVERLAGLAKQNGCHYVIFSKEQTFQGRLEDYSYEWFGESGEYVIYRDTDIYIGL